MFVVTTSYTVGLAVTGYAVSLVADRSLDATSGVWWTVGLGVWAFTYASVSQVIAGRTTGKTLVGLRIVNRDGTPLRPRAAVMRVAVMPLTFVTLGIAFIGLFIGRERRALHAVLAGPAAGSAWGDRAAELPAPLTRFLAANQNVPDDFDEIVPET